MPLQLRETLRFCWKSLVLADILFKVIAYIALTPIVALVFRLFLSWSGREVLADVDIAKFLLHPIGWAAFVIVIGCGVGILALEQAVILTIALGASRKQTIGVFSALQFVARRAAAVIRLTSRMMLRVLLISAPFLLVGGGLYVALLTKYDINFYLSEKPPVFWIAVALIGAVLVALGAILLRLVVGWSLALPLLMFEGFSPKQSLAASSDRTKGHRLRTAAWIVAWLAANWIVSIMLSMLVVWIAHLVVPRVNGSIWILALAVGASLSLLYLTNVFANLVANISFGLLLATLYEQRPRSEAIGLPNPVESGTAGPLRLTRGRIVSAACIGVVLATFVGATTVHSIDLEDRVQITAHRGGAIHSPENTLAAIRRAIDDGTDWVEIDVQESKDGIVVVAHDSDLKKVAGSSTKIWEATADELRAIDIGSYFNASFKDERVPTLAEVLQCCKGRTKVNIELKYYGHDEELEQRVVSLVEEHDMVADIVIMSLESKGIQKMKGLRPQWTAGQLIAVKAGDATRAAADFLAVKTSLATPEFIKSAHAAQKAVYVWTVNDAATMSAMISRGVDNIITDNPALARQVLAERAEMSPLERVLIELSLLLGVKPAASSDSESP